jgi:N6-L-threonylcarbamoyladenine synthase
MVIVLGIESTCDETACAIVENGNKIFSNIVASQTDLHEIYGGVVPELACRRHAEVIIPMIRQALEEAHLSLKEIDLIAVAKGPGLIGALLIGLNTAKALALASEKPFIGINHIEAHLYASIMSQPQEIAFPCLGLVISGGHTSLVDVQSIGQYRLVGQTTDDAVGEAFDKVAQLLSLPYPGGPRIEALALAGDPHRYPFKAGVVKGKPLDFSFSGLKTSVMYAIKGQSASKTAPLIIQEEDKKDVAASFQHVALSDIVKKAVLAAEQLGSKAILVGGGVSCNKYLRKLFAHAGLSIPIHWPSQGLSLDNAAMIAGLAFHKYQLHPKGDDLSLEAATRLPF